MNRFYYLLTGMVIILVLIISCSDDESEGSEHIIDICHYDEVTGTWENLSIVENTLETHERSVVYIGAVILVLIW